MIALLRVELIKATERLRTLIAFAVAVGIPILVGLAVKARGDRGDRGERGGSMFRLARQSGLVLPGVALTLMSVFFLVVIWVYDLLDVPMMTLILALAMLWRMRRSGEGADGDAAVALERSA